MFKYRGPATHFSFCQYDLMHAHLYLGSVSCPDVTNRQAVDKWGSTVLERV